MLIIVQCIYLSHAAEMGPSHRGKIYKTCCEHKQYVEYQEEWIAANKHLCWSLFTGKRETWLLADLAVLFIYSSLFWLEHERNVSAVWFSVCSLDKWYKFSSQCKQDLAPMETSFMQLLNAWNLWYCPWS